MDIFKITVQEFDDLYRKSTTQLYENTKQLTQQYRDCIRDERLLAFDHSITKIFSSNKSFLHEKLKANFSKKDYSYLIDRAEGEIRKMNEEIMSVRKLYLVNESNILPQNQRTTITYQNSQLKSEDSSINSMHSIGSDSILKLPAAKLVRLNQKDIEQRLKDSMRYKVMNALAARIQRVYRKYIRTLKPIRIQAALKIQRGYRQYREMIKTNQDEREKKNAAKIIYKQYTAFKQQQTSNKNMHIKIGLQRLDAIVSLKMKKKSFKQMLMYSLIRLRIETRAYQVFKTDPHRVHLNNVDHEELKKIIPDEGKYKMSAVFWDYILKSKVYYKWLLFAALRRKRTTRQSQ